MQNILLEERNVKWQGKIVGPLSNIVARLTSRREDTFEDMIAIRANFVEEHAVSLLADGNKIGRCGWVAKTPPESLLKADCSLIWSLQLVKPHQDAEAYDRALTRVAL